MATETENVVEEEEVAEMNPLDVSDDDFNDLPEPGQETPEPDKGEDDGLQAEDEAEPEPKDEASSEEVTEEPAAPVQQDMFAGAADATPDTEKAPEKPSESADDTQPAKAGDTPDIDYKAEYERLIAPFRANGKDMQIASIDDARTLMSMGANYNKKMAALKPNLKLLKMLENNDLLDEGKLSYLIDLDKKNPEAINKFIKESGVDPMDIDADEPTDYKPNTYTVNDKEVELDAVLDDIKESPAYAETIDVVGNKWDKASKQIILETPVMLRVINAHIENGIYKQITDVVEHERTLGRLTDISDFAAYKLVGDAMQAKGAFTGMQPATAPAAPPDDVPKADPALKNRKRAASPTKNAPGKKAPADFNPLAVSDEEFEKIAGSQYM